MSDVTYCAAAGCGRPTNSNVLCKHCDALLKQHLAEMPWVFDELRIVLTKRARFTRGGPGGKSQENPMPMNITASQVISEVTKVVNEWQGRLADHVGQPVRYPNPITAVAWMLTAHSFGKTTTWVDTGHMLDQLTLTRTNADKVIYGPKDKWFAGICSIVTNDHECDADLYADTDKGDLECWRCGHIHDIANRRAALLKHAENTFATATEAARAVIVWSDYERGENLLVKRIGMWAERKRITQRGTILQDGKHRPLYRIGDILDLLASDAHAKAS